MSATVRILQHVEVNIGGEWCEIGSRKTPEEITITGEKFETLVQVTNAVADDAGDYARQLLWQNGDGGIDDFDVLVMESDEDIILELTSDKDTDDAGPEYASIKCEGGVPLILTSDDMVGIITTDSTVTSFTDAQIDQIAVQNPSATVNTATVRLVLLT